MKADIDITMTYPYPADRVWAALTSSEALSAWFMPNDFKPAVGHRFTFRARAFRALGFDGTVRCEVLELDPPTRMVWSWAGGNIDTTVTFTLEQTAGGTRLRMRQVGFDGLGGQLTRRILGGGYPRILGQRLPAYLDQATARSPDAPPPPAQCAQSGGRRMLGPFRRPNGRSSRDKGDSMALTNLEVVSVPVTDQDAAKSFYTEKLGFSVQIDNSFADGSMRWVMLRPPAGGTAITLVTWFETMPAGSLRGAVIGCDDLERTLADLTARGVGFNEDTVQEAPWGRWKTFDDPDGNGWVLQQNNPAFGV